MKSQDVLSATGLTYRQLDYWTQRGYLSAEGIAGRGNRREWSPREVTVAGVMHHLIAAGIEASVAAELARTASNPYTAQPGPQRFELAPGIVLEISAEKLAQNV